MRTVFIQANNKQLLGAKLAQFAIERNLKNKSSVSVRIMNTDSIELFKKFSGIRFRRESYHTRDGHVQADEDDLQSFTLSRFLPPELMEYTGTAVVIDPDIFALTEITKLFEMDSRGKAIMACRNRHGAWDSSVMRLDCSQLTGWHVSDMLQELANGAVDYDDIMMLKKEQSVAELPRIWNSIDRLGEDTNMLHTSNRLTQPWKTGLPIDFVRKFEQDRYWGVIPKRWIKRIAGRWPMKYQPHPDKKIEDYFFRLLKDAIQDGAVTVDMVKSDIDAGFLRADLLEQV